MPLYTWQCEKCGEKIEVMRKADDYRIPPNKTEEAEESVCSECSHAWQKLIDASLWTSRTAAWAKDGSKGNWIILLLAASALFGCNRVVFCAKVVQPITCVPAGSMWDDPRCRVRLSNGVAATVSDVVVLGDTVCYTSIENAWLSH